MLSFKEFVNEAKSQAAIEVYFAKTKNLTFVEDLVNKNGYRGSEYGNNNDKTFVAVLGVNGHYYDIFSLTGDERREYGQNVYRYESRAISVTKLMRPLVKIDMSKGMLYYMTEESHDTDVVKFETRGNKLEFVVVYKKQQFLENQK